MSSDSPSVSLPNRRQQAVRRRALLALADGGVLIGGWMAIAGWQIPHLPTGLLIGFGMVPALALIRGWQDVGGSLASPSWTARCLPAVSMCGLVMVYLAMALVISGLDPFHPVPTRFFLWQPLLAWFALALSWVVLSRLPGSAGGPFRRRVVLVGHPDSCRRVHEHLHGATAMAADPIEVIDEMIWSPGPVPPTLIDCLVERLLPDDVDEVLLCTELSDHQAVELLLRKMQGTSVAVRLVPDLADLPLFCLRSGEVAGMPALHLSASPLSDGSLVVKWIEDKFLSVLILLFIWPVLLAVAVAVRLSGPGPVIFVQERHGLGGRVIRVYKFRTMHAGMLPAPGDSSTGGTTRLGRIAIKERLSTDFVQASAGDPRITRLGRFMRNTSIDELPQFINVLQGRMSIVGPRPHPLKLNHRFTPEIADLMRRHYVKPGITGLAQISGSRGETRDVDAMRTRVEFDLAYIRKWSLGLDLRIIGMTVFKGFINHQP